MDRGSGRPWSPSSHGQISFGGPCRIVHLVTLRLAAAPAAGGPAGLNRAGVEDGDRDPGLAKERELRKRLVEPPADLAAGTDVVADVADIVGFDELRRVGHAAGQLGSRVGTSPGRRVAVGSRVVGEGPGGAKGELLVQRQDRGSLVGIGADRVPVVAATALEG